jgi:hypothetical protein
MFHYVYLNKNNNLIDIRLDASINPFNFHQHMENLGLLNILFIIAWVSTSSTKLDISL